MNWLTELLTTRDHKYLTGLLSRVFCLVILCCSNLAIADPQDKSIKSDDLGWIDSNAQAIEDVDLSFINGKGAEVRTLDDGGKVAVILWDEHGKVNRRSASYDTNYSVSTRPAINLTVMSK